MPEICKVPFQETLAVWNMAIGKKKKNRILEKTKKINKSLARVSKKKRERTQINKIRTEREDTTIDTTRIQRNITNSYYSMLLI